MSIYRVIKRIRWKKKSRSLVGVSKNKNQELKKLEIQVGKIETAGQLVLLADLLRERYST